MPDPILVLGGPRSGTSAVAGVLHALGVHMGDGLASCPEWNAKGFFEDDEIGGICTDWVYPREIQGRMADYMPKWPGPEFGTDLQERLRAAISRRSGLWGVKGARLAYLLDYFPPAKVIVCERDAEASAQSWAARSGCSIEDSRVVIANAAEAVEKGLAGRDWPTLRMQYEAIDVAAIAAFAGVPVTEAALSHLDPSLRRF